MKCCYYEGKDFRNDLCFLKFTDGYNIQMPALNYGGLCATSLEVDFVFFFVFQTT
jgi:hypothetical protein